MFFVSNEVVVGFVGVVFVFVLLGAIFSVSATIAATDASTDASTLSASVAVVLRISSGDILLLFGFFLVLDAILLPFFVLVLNFRGPF